MNEIGGYFELELPRGEEYHINAIRLNTGRNAFEYILRAKGYIKAYLPFYTCDVMLESIKKLNINYQFYTIDKQFRPIFDFSSVEDNAVFVYTNYFGLCDKLVKEVSEKCKNLIIDNSQAFYSLPLSGVDTFYSPRKFYGIPDGAYLYTDTLLDNNFETDISHQRFEHLLGREDIGAKEFYAAFKRNDEALSNQPIKLMSKLTQKLLSGIDYKTIAKIRRENFIFLNSKLSDRNELNLNLDYSSVPMVYPFLVNEGEQLKKILILNSVFVATYWPNVLDWVDENDFEYELNERMIALPIDQRYSETDMGKIVNIINNYV